METLTDKKYLLKKFPGKGGWTYAEVPEISQNSKNPFGWVCVKGSIDTYSFDKFKLMPMGNGKLFFSVNATIRKKIKKAAGDWVHLKLYADETPTELTDELKECFEINGEGLIQKFETLSKKDQHKHLDAVYSAKTEEQKTEKIVKLIDKLHLIN